MADYVVGFDLENESSHAAAQPVNFPTDHFRRISEAGPVARLAVALIVEQAGLVQGGISVDGVAIGFVPNGMNSARGRISLIKRAAGAQTTGIMA